MASLTELSRFAKSEMYYSEPRRRIPGATVAGVGAGGSAGIAAYLGNASRKTTTGKKFLRKKAGKAAGIAAVLGGTAYGVKRLNDGA